MKIFYHENLELYGILENPAAQEVARNRACVACIVTGTILILLCNLNLHVKIGESQKIEILQRLLLVIVNLL